MDANNFGSTSFSPGAIMWSEQQAHLLKYPRDWAPVMDSGMLPKHEAEEEFRKAQKAGLLDLFVFPSGLYICMNINISIYLFICIYIHIYYTWAFSATEVFAARLRGGGPARRAVRHHLGEPGPRHRGAGRRHRAAETAAPAGDASTREDPGVRQEGVERVLTAIACCIFRL